LHGFSTVDELQAEVRSAAGDWRVDGWLAAGEKHQVLLGVTGSVKTFTMARLTALPVLSSRQRWASTNL
jgi:hypothetical protein